MSLEFLPRSLVTTTLGFVCEEEEREDDDDDARMEKEGSKIWQRILFAVKAGEKNGESDGGDRNAIGKGENWN